MPKAVTFATSTPLLREGSAMRSSGFALWYPAFHRNNTFTHARWLRILFAGNSHRRHTPKRHRATQIVLSVRALAAARHGHIAASCRRRRDFAAINIHLVCGDDQIPVGRTQRARQMVAGIIDACASATVWALRHFSLNGKRQLFLAFALISLSAD